MQRIATTTTLDFVELPAAELLGGGGHPALRDALAEMSTERRGGVVLRGALPRDTIARAMARLSAPDGPVPPNRSPQFAGHTYGAPLVSTGADLSPYFRATEGLQAGLDAAFGMDLVAHHQRIFGAMSGGRPVGVPDKAGRRYAAMTLRVLGHGGRLPMHCGNETHSWPSMAHLRTRIDPTDQLSFFTLLHAADSGGELLIYDYKHRWPGERPPGEAPIDMAGEEVPAAVVARGVLPAGLRPGDMIVFDGGRIFHRVVPVQGDTPRWTLGGFMALSADRDGVLFWS
jgi:hypothetical protein